MLQHPIVRRDAWLEARRALLEEKALTRQQDAPNAARQRLPWVHLRHHDITLIAVSCAPLAKLEAYRARMGWCFDWASSAGGSFNHDFGVSFTEAERASGKKRCDSGTLAPDMDELPGTSVFARDATGAVFHTCSAYARGDERSLGAYMFLTPKGRNENGPHRTLMDWVERHDECAVTQPAGGCCA